MTELKEIRLIRYENGVNRLDTDYVLEEVCVCLEDSNGDNYIFKTIPEEYENLFRGHLLSAKLLKIESIEKNENFYAQVKKYNPKNISRRHQWKEDLVLHRANQLLEYSNYFKKTGNMHAAMIIFEDQVFYGEDIGRHNAIDRAIGKAAASNIDFSQCELYTSGRMPYDIVKKCILLKIPLLVSRSAPTINSINLATENKISLIGFARKNRMNIYKDFR